MSREEYIAILELENAELKNESKEQQQVIKDKSFIIDKLMQENRELKEQLKIKKED